MREIAVARQRGLRDIQIELAHRVENGVDVRRRGLDVVVREPDVIVATQVIRLGQKRMQPVPFPAWPRDDEHVVRMLKSGVGVIEADDQVPVSL